MEENPSVDEIVSKIENLEDEVDSFTEFDHDEIKETADETLIQRLQHLVHDDCDTEVCNELRDEFGLHGEPEPEDEETEEPEEPEADAEPDEEPEADDDSGDDEPDRDVPWSEGENIFGESV